LPALKRWAKLDRPPGLSFRCALFWRGAEIPVLANTLQALIAAIRRAPADESKVSIVRLDSSVGSLTSVSAEKKFSDADLAFRILKPNPFNT
jgi:hypothetical protein